MKRDALKVVQFIRINIGAGASLILATLTGGLLNKIKMGSKSELGTLDHLWIPGIPFLGKKY